MGAQRKMSQTSTNSPSRSTPRSARKLHKDKEVDVKKKEDDEKKKVEEKISIKEDLGSHEKKKKDGRKKDEEKQADTSHKNIKEPDIKNKDVIAPVIDKGEEEKRIKNDEKKKNELNIDSAKSSPAQRKMSRSSSNSPSRPTPRSARQFYKDEDPKKKVEVENKKDSENVIKDEVEVCENKKKEERSIESCHKNKENEVQNKDLSMDIQEGVNVLDTKKLRKVEDILKVESSIEPHANKENIVKEEKAIK